MAAKHVPHLVQYQGSKRKLASAILQYVPSHSRRIIEPFAGMAAISIAAACSGCASEFILNDINAPLVNMLQEAVEHPSELLKKYATLWNDQFSHPHGHVQHFYDIRDVFNSGRRTSENMLYLLARCVKGSVRYSRNGNFNQSPDRRRHGTSPMTLKKNIFDISNVLHGKTCFFSLDYRDILGMATAGDLVYMDPPYQGVVDTCDRRYHSGIDFEEFVSSLDCLNRRNIDFIVSYDGSCGDKTYGNMLPSYLDCKHITLHAGLSSQSILLGRREQTREALYVSRNISIENVLHASKFSLLESA